MAEASTTCRGRASDPGKTLRLTEPVAGATLVRPLLHSSLFQLRSYGQRTGQIVQRLECPAGLIAALTAAAGGFRVT